MIKNKGLFFKVILVLLLIIFILVLIGNFKNKGLMKIANVNSYAKEAFEIQDFEWYSHTTTTDGAYNGNHIIVNGNSILFNGYGIPAYKDFLFNHHDVEGTKIFNFRISELVTDWHTLEGGGFLFNSKIENGKLSGYCLLYEKSALSIYSLENIDVNAFHDSTNQTIKSNYGTLIVSVVKPTTSIHNLKIIATPTNVKVIDNTAEVINKNLDYAKHYGNGYGPIVSYTQHNCSSLSKIQFEELEVIEEFPIKVYKYSQDGKPIKGAIFDIKDSSGNLINTVTSDENGLIEQSLSKGQYTYTEKQAADNYVLDTTTHTINVDKDGNATGDTKIYNKLKTIQFITVDADDSSKIQGNTISIYKLVDGKKQEVYKGTTNSNGTLDWNANNSLTEGTYIYQETYASKGYILNNIEYTVEINKFNQDGTFYGKIITNNNDKVEYSNIGSIEIKNNPITVILVKVNEINEKLKDAKFEIYNESGSFKSTYTTDSNGQIILKKLEPGEYLFKETSAPNGYTLNDTIYKFQVDENGNVTGTTRVVNKEKLPETQLPSTGIKTISLIFIGILLLNAWLAFSKAFKKAK